MVSCLPQQAVIPLARETGGVSVNTQLLSDLREAFFDRNFDDAIYGEFTHAESVIEQAPFALVGLGSVFCMRRYDTGAVLNFLELIIAADGETQPERAVDAMASEAMLLFDDSRPKAYNRLWHLAMRCGIFSAVVAVISEAWLERHGVAVDG